MYFDLTYNYYYSKLTFFSGCAHEKEKKPEKIINYINYIGKLYFI